MSLDANGDGVIDFNEFRTWYLNGQKKFSVARRTFTKFAGSLGFLKEKGAEVSSAMKSAKKMKKQKINIKFNAPEEPNDKIQARFSLMGKDHDYWLEEANKFWSKNLPDEEKSGPISYVRVAIPHSNKRHFQALSDYIKSSESYKRDIN
jgi:hypothetical protein